MRKLLLAGALAAVAIPAVAATRLTYEIKSTPVEVAWAKNAFPLQYVVDTRVANAIPNATATIDRAFAEWAETGDTDVRFASKGVANAAFGHDGQNSVTLADDLYANQKFIALTTNWYDDSGKMTEADIQIDSASFTSGNYNVQQLVAHEIGHLLGFDHSAVLSSVMYPYVGRGGTNALDSDDRVAINALYPSASPTAGATMRGQVIGNSGGIFAAQVVAVNTQGEPVATTLTNDRGEFELTGVPEGTYRLYAEPLDGPVAVQNLSGFWTNARVESFPTQFAQGDPMPVQTGKIYGGLVVNSSGAPVKLNPRWIGSAKPNADGVALSSTTQVVRGGTTVQLAVGGDGFTSGMTQFEVLNPGFHRVGDYRYGSNYVYATYELAPNAASGSVVILVKSGNETATLTGALRVEGVPRVRVARK